MERVASFLRDSGAEARIEGFAVATPTALDAARAVVGDEAQAVDPSRDHVGGTERRVGGLAEENDASFRPRRERADPHVVRV